MARAATTTDAFNAVAEPQRRRILTLLKGRERSVNELAGGLRVSQSRVSKHLRVLREVPRVGVGLEYDGARPSDEASDDELAIRRGRCAAHDHHPPPSLRWSRFT